MMFEIQAGTKSVSSTRPTNLTTITPGPTPSPNKTTAVQAQGSAFPNARTMGPQSPVSPISPDGSRRPFSYEAIPKQQRPQVQQPPRAQSAQSAQSMSPVSPPAATTSFPPRSTSRPNAQPQAQGPTFPFPQFQTARSPSPPNADSPPFTPLVIRPAPSAAAPITDKHLNCYAHHTNYVWSKNECQPMACMVCHENNRERKWACVWCYLRVCIKCSDELMRTPGRDLKVVIERRGQGQGQGQQQGQQQGSANTSRNGTPIPTMVIWEAENEDEKDDFS